MEAFKMTLDDYIKICEMAIENGKKPGESMEKEMREYIKNKKHIEKIGAKDIDLLKGNLREQGYYKILDLRKYLRGDDK